MLTTIVAGGELLQTPAWLAAHCQAGKHDLKFGGNIDAG
jgi:hypothetical protein